MSTVREKIINALTLFYTAIKSKFVLVGNVVNNCASTSTTYPLAANQGTQLQNQIDELNSNFGNYANKNTANTYLKSQKISYDADIDSGLYNDAALVLQANTSTTGSLASLGFHNGGATGLGVYLSGYTLRTITNNGTEDQIAFLSNVTSQTNSLKTSSKLNVSWNSAGVNSGWAYGYYFTNLGFGILQGGFSAKATGDNLTLGTITGSYNISENMTFPVSTGDSGGLGGYGHIKTNGTLVFKVVDSGSYAFCCFLF